MSKTETVATANFIRNIIEEDVKAGKIGGRVITRFPPEPNGFLHIGHAKTICLNFGVAAEKRGHCYLRFDDTNPSKESTEYVEAIKEDIRWLGFDWEDRLRFASNYFEQLYAYAIRLIKKGKAYVCSLTPEKIREYRGSPREPGRDSPYRTRSVEENLDLFQRMRAGEFHEGAHILRAKIDMSSANLNMRDPTIYRIRRMSHHQTGDVWVIYPMYDFTHCLSDSIEGITHSLCTLEFEDHRPLYDWFLDELETACHPQQIEFSRLYLEYTLMSKRKMIALVEEGHVQGWDDPRIWTLAGFRRRGYTPKSIRDFCKRIGISKSESITEMYVLEDCIRQDLEEKAVRMLAVLQPLKVVIENFQENQVEELEARFHPYDESLGTRMLPFSKELYIDRNDFEEEPPPKFKRLSPGKEVRLRYGYVIRCNQVIKDERGNVIELRCNYDPDTLGKKPIGRKVKGVIHWVSTTHSFEAEVRLYDRLFLNKNPAECKISELPSILNPHSLKIVKGYLEKDLQGAKPGDRYQFEREGYFFVDPIDSQKNTPVFNRIVTLRDSWTKKESNSI